MDTSRVWAEIDLDALAHNLETIRRRIDPDVAIILVAKADAYGHGAVAVAHHAVSCGVAAIGVGTATEALNLRRAGIRARILVLGTIVDEEVRDVLEHDVEIGLHSSDRCRRLQSAAARLGRRGRVHLNVDTGMGRLGVLPERAIELLRMVSTSPNLELVGVMTHIASSEGARAPSTARQLECFEACLARAREEDLLPDSAWIHAANSACVLSGVRPLYDAVRTGIAAYGIAPAPLEGVEELRPVLSLRTKVVFLKDIPRGTSVGYEGEWTAPRRSRIVTLPIGYDDGLPFRLGGRGAVLIRGRRAPLVGRISMDYATADVTGIAGIRVGDVATLIGADGSERIRTEDVAELAGTIPYEVVCSVGERVGRVYRGGELEIHPAQPRRKPLFRPIRRAPAADPTPDQP
ncbi:MAG: alanine racemase [Planctomycetota bacterium]|nr:alanine racemase [Planctomycetota bacterium]